MYLLNFVLVLAKSRRCVCVCLVVVLLLLRSVGWFTAVQRTKPQLVVRRRDDDADDDDDGHHRMLLRLVQLSTQNQPPNVAIPCSLAGGVNNEKKTFWCVSQKKLSSARVLRQKESAFSPREVIQFGAKYWQDGGVRVVGPFLQPSDALDTPTRACFLFLPCGLCNQSPEKLAFAPRWEVGRAPSCCWLSLATSQLIWPAIVLLPLTSFCSCLFAVDVAQTAQLK